VITAGPAEGRSSSPIHNNKDTIIMTTSSPGSVPGFTSGGPANGGTVGQPDFGARQLTVPEPVPARDMSRVPSPQSLGRRASAWIGTDGQGNQISGEGDPFAMATEGNQIAGPRCMMVPWVLGCLWFMRGANNMLSSQQRTLPVPPPKGFVRKILTVPPALAEAVKEFRFNHRLESDVDAYRLLIQEGLDSFERKEKAEPTERKP
jgi:hypothetical protein